MSWFDFGEESEYVRIGCNKQYVWFLGMIWRRIMLIFLRTLVDGATRREPKFKCWINFYYEVLIVVLISLISSIELQFDCGSVILFKLVDLLPF